MLIYFIQGVFKDDQTGNVQYYNCSFGMNAIQPLFLQDALYMCLSALVLENTYLMLACYYFNMVVCMRFSKNGFYQFPFKNILYYPTFFPTIFFLYHIAQWWNKMITIILYNKHILLQNYPLLYLLHKKKSPRIITIIEQLNAETLLQL